MYMCQDLEVTVQPVSYFTNCCCSAAEVWAMNPTTFTLTLNTKVFCYQMLLTNFTVIRRVSFVTLKQLVRVSLTGQDCSAFLCLYSWMLYATFSSYRTGQKSCQTLSVKSPGCCCSVVLHDCRSPRAPTSTMWFPEWILCSSSFSTWPRCLWCFQTTSWKCFLVS